MAKDITVLVVVRLPDKSKRNVNITINDGLSGQDLMDNVRAAVGAEPEATMRLLVGGAPVDDLSLSLKEGLNVVDGAKLMASVTSTASNGAPASATPAPLPPTLAESAPLPGTSAVPMADATPRTANEPPRAGIALDADVYGAVHVLGGDALVHQVDRAGISTAAALLTLLKADPSAFGLSTPQRAKLLNALKKQVTVVPSAAHPKPAPTSDAQTDDAQRRRHAAEQARQDQLKAQFATKMQNLSHGEASTRQLIHSTEQAERNNIGARKLQEIPLPSTASGPAADTNWIEVEIDGVAHTLPVNLDVATAETVRQFVRSKKGASMVVTLTNDSGSGLTEGPLRASVRYGERVRAVANLPGG